MRSIVAGLACKQILSWVKPLVFFFVNGSGSRRISPQSPYLGKRYGSGGSRFVKMFRNNIFLLQYNVSLIATIVNTTMTYSIGKFSVNLQINFTNIYVFQNSLYKYSTKQTCPQIMRINLIIIRLGTSFFSFNCLLPLRARVKVAV